jgi:protocatechuate 3,4-dioxygenase beta subunit
MKPLPKFIFISFLIFIYSSKLLSAIVSSTTTGGNWNSASTWQGGVIPVDNDNVIIATTTGNSVVINATTAKLGSVTINSGATLVGGGVYNLRIGKGSGTDFVNNGTFIANTVTVRCENSSIWDGNGNWFLYAINDNGNTLTINFSSLDTIHLSAPSPMTGTGSISPGTNCVFDFNGTSTQTLSTDQDHDYFHLLVSNTVGVNLTRSLTSSDITGNFILANNAVFNLNTFTITGNSGKTMTMNASSTLNVDPSFPTGFGTYSLNTTSTVNYILAGSQTISSTPSYGNLTLSSSGTKTAGGNLTVNGNFTISGSATFNGGTSRTHNFYGNWTNNSSAGTPFSYSTSSTIIFNTPGTPAATTFGGTTSATTSFNNITISNTSGFTVNKNFSSSGTLSVSSNASVTPDSLVILNGSGTLSGNGTVKVTRITNGSNNFSSQYSISNKTLTNLSVVYIGTAAQVVSAYTYNNLTISNTSSAGVSASSNFSVNGNFYIDFASKFTPAASVIISGTGTLNGLGKIYVTRTSAPADLLSQYTISNIVLSGGFLQFLTVEYSSSSPQTINALNYAYLVSSSSGSRTLASSGTIGIAGTFTAGTNSYTVTGSTINFNGTSSQTIPAFNYNNITISGARTTNNVTFTSSGTIGIAGTFSSTATFTTGAYVITGSTVDYNGTSAQTVAAFNYNHLTISGARTTNSVTLASSGTIGIAGSFTNSATFTSGGFITANSTVDYNGSSSQTVASFNYYHLTSSSTGSRSANGTIGIEGTFTPGSNSWTVTGSTFDFISTGIQTIPAFSYYNLSSSIIGIRILSSSGIIQVAGTFNPGNGGYDNTGSTIEFNSSGTQTIPIFNYYNLSSSSSGNRNLASPASIGIAGTFSPGINTYNIDNTTLDFNGSGAQTIPAFHYYNLTISGARTTNNVTLIPSGTIGIASSFTVSATFTSGGIVTTNNTVDFNGTITQTIPAFNYYNLTSSNSGNRTLSSSGTIGIANTFTPGSNSYTNNGSTIVFNGGAQTIVGFVFNNLTTSGTASKTANGNITVNGILALSTNLNMGANNLLMGSGSSTSGTGDVTGNVRRTSFSPNTAYSFGNQFTSITFASGGTLPSQMDMNISIGSTPAGKPDAIERSYDISSTGGSGFSSTLRLHYLSNELNGNTATTLDLYKYTTSWMNQGKTGAVDTANKYAELSGVTSFSQWTLGSPYVLTSFVMALSSSQIDGIAFSGTNTITAKDQFGNTLTSFDASVDNVTITNTPNDGSVSGLGSGGNNVLNLSSDFVNGVANLSGKMVFIGFIGSHTFTATSSSNVIATSGGVTIQINSAAKLAFTTHPGNGTGGSNLSTQPSVTIQDIGGNIVSGATNAITLSIGTNPGSGTLSVAVNPLNATNSVANFTGVKVDKIGNGYTFVASSPGLTNATSNSFNITEGTPTQLSFQTQPGNGTGGNDLSVQPIISILDAGGNIVSSATNSISLAIGNNPAGGTLSANTNPFNAMNGLATFSGVKIDKAGNGYTLVATSAGLASATSSLFNISSGAASKLVFSLQPGNGTGGTNLSIQPAIAIQDAGGNTVTSATNEITIAIVNNPSSGILSVDANPLSAINGVASFTGVKIDKIGNGYTLIATATGLTNATSNSFNITVGTPYQLAFTTEPGNGTGGSNISTQPVVTVHDAGGNTVTTAANSISLSIGNNPSGGTLSVTTNPLNATNGIATFSGVNINKAGSGYTLVASAIGLVIATSSPFDISVGTPEKLAFSVQPGDGSGGNNLSVQPEVVIQDAGGNTVASAIADVTIAIGSNPSSGTLSVDNNPLAVTSGTAMFSGVKIDKIGNGYTLVASSFGLTSATSNAFNITAGAPFQLTFSIQPGNGTGGNNLSVQPVILIQDAGGNVITSATNSITLSIGNNPGSGTLFATTNPLNAVSGVATFSGVKIDKAGTGYTLLASATGLTSATSNAFDIVMGTATRLSFTTQPGNSTGGISLSVQPVVSIQDDGGNTVTSATNAITIAIGNNPSVGALSVDANPMNAVSGNANFSGVKIDKAGNGYTLLATAIGLSSATSNAFNISVGPATKLTFTTQPSNGFVSTNLSTQPVLTIQDEGGNTVTASTDAITLAIGTNPSSGTLSASTNPLNATNGVASFSGIQIDKAGTGYTLTANATGLTMATSSAFTISNPVPTTTSISPSSKNVGDLGFSMTVNGTNFVETSVVRLAGSDRVTTFISSTELSAAIPSSDMTIGSTYNITVFNPTPGGGTSNAQIFTVIGTGGSISGMKFLDLNGNGTKDSNETGLANWKIRISGAANDSAITDQDGNYSFTNLDVGVYIVSEDQQIGWVQSFPTSPAFYTVNLGNGQIVTGKHFGNYQLGSISGINFHDANGNGTKDNGETGLANWKIKISGTRNDSTLTDGNGNYFFSNIPPGNYTISEIIPVTWVQTKPTSPGTYALSLTSGQNATGKDFGNYQLNSVNGIVFIDLNGNGVKDNGESGALNWKVYLSGTSSETTQTDTDGLYSFQQLPPGNYTMSEEHPASWIQTFPAVPGTYDITLTSGQNLNDKNFGNYEYSSISGMKFHDINGNGVKDIGETGLQNWKIYIAGNINSFALTDASGNYTMNNIPPGNYTISEEVSANWARSFPPTGTYSETISSGQHLTNRDFGNYQYSTISGLIFHDINSNGSQDIGEPGLQNWKVKITGTKNDSVFTDANGNYLFSTVSPGNYTLQEILPIGFVQTFPNEGTYNLSVSSGQTFQNKNFGNFQYGSISGNVFRDVNGNAVHDVGEVGLTSWKIYINGPLDDSVLTDENGFYLFQFLYAGTYSISEEHLEGWVQSLPVGNGIHVVNIISGQNVFNKNFGNYQLSSAGGTIFNDLNGNGVKDAEDTGISDWTVLLSGDAFDTVTTDANGNYFFENIPLGTYNISEVLQPSWVRTKPLPSGMYSFSVTSENISGLDFGNYQYGSISGIVFHDNNGDGIRDAGENGLTNWNVKLSGASNDSMLTTEEGFSFTNLAPGNYTLSEELQTTWGMSLPTSPGTYSITLTSGTNLTTKNFGNYLYSSISGNVFEDFDGDSSNDVSETALVGWKVKISGTKSDSTTSDSSGNYSFNNLKPGTYTVLEVVQSTWTQTKPSSPGIYSTNLTSGTNVTKKDFGNFKLVSISGVVYKDYDEDSVRDENEGGKSGWTVKLYGYSTASKITDANGTFTFSNVAPGTYFVEQTLQTAFLGSQNAAGVTLVVNQSGTNISNTNFGIYQIDTTKYRTFNATPELSYKAIKMKYDKKANTMLPQPNLASVLENTFRRIKFYLGATGYTFLGVDQSNKDSAKKYAWIVYKTAKDLGKLYTTPHTGKSYPIDSLRITGKKSKKLSKGFKADKKKFDNVAWEQGVLFNLNIKASDYSITPYGFGNLILDTPATFVGKSVQGMRLRDIRKLYDSVMTYYLKYGVYTEEQYASLDTFVHTVLKPINERFAEAFDLSTNAFIDSTSLKIGEQLTGGTKNTFAVRLRGIKTSTEEGGLVRFVFTKEELFAHELQTTAVIPEHYILEQNYPNPFNPSTTIKFTLPTASSVTLTIYNTLGQKIGTLLDNTPLEKGTQEIVFHAENVSSGIYFYRLNATSLEEDNEIPSSITQVKKMLLVK